MQIIRKDDAHVGGVGLVKKQTVRIFFIVVGLVLALVSAHFLESTMGRNNGSTIPLGRYFATGPAIIAWLIFSVIFVLLDIWCATWMESQFLRGLLCFIAAPCVAIAVIVSIAGLLS
jgi:hypothetical protein